MGVNEVIVLGVVMVVVVDVCLGLWIGFVVVGVRVCQILAASGRRVVGSVVMGSVPRRKKMDRGGLVKSEGWGDVMFEVW